MSKENKDIARIYFLDRPAFLSCGKTYITDAGNRIILLDDNYGHEDTLKLKFNVPSDMPYLLAPYPLRNQKKDADARFLSARKWNGVKPVVLDHSRHHDWNAVIRNGKKVYPSCLVDTSGSDSPEQDENVPVVLGIKTVSRAELEGFVSAYNGALECYTSDLNSALKGVDVRYRDEKKELERKIKSAKSRVRKKHAAPDLCEIVFGRL